MIAEAILVTISGSLWAAFELGRIFQIYKYRKDLLLEDSP